MERLQVADDNVVEGRDSERNDLSHFKRLLREQQETIEDLLSEQKREFVERVDPNRSHSFNQKSLEKQFDVNRDFLLLAKKIQKCLDKQQIYQAKDHIENLLDELKTHQEDLIAADISRNGWLAVARLRDKCSLPKSLLKELEKVDDQIDNRRKKYRNGRTGERSSEVDKETQRNPNKFFKPQQGGGKPQKKSPEEILQEATRQTRAGVCSHCKQEGHFFRECAGFWTKVLENRKAFAEKN